MCMYVPPLLCQPGHPRGHRLGADNFASVHPKSTRYAYSTQILSLSLFSLSLSVCLSVSLSLFLSVSLSLYVSDFLSLCPSLDATPPRSLFQPHRSHPAPLFAVFEVIVLMRAIPLLVIRRALERILPENAVSKRSYERSALLHIARYRHPQHWGALRQQNIAHPRFSTDHTRSEQPTARGANTTCRPEGGSVAAAAASAAAGFQPDCLARSPRCRSSMWCARGVQVFESAWTT